jgi:UDP-glucuronate 4-epimerase
MAHTYSHLYNIPTTGLRFFTVYGPWGRPDMATFLFTEAILANKPIKVFNYGNMKRDFTYVEDIVEGVYKVLKNSPNKRNEKVPYALYNIGNSKPIDLLEFIKILESKLGKEAKKEMLPLQDGDVHETYADVSALQNDFGYKPNTNIEAGIEQFVNWYKEHYKVNI